MAVRGRPPHEIDIDRALAVFAAGSEERGPTVRAFQQALGLSSTDVAVRRFRRLEAAGYIERIPTSAPYDSRRYRLTAKGRALATPLPVEAVQ